MMDKFNEDTVAPQFSEEQPDEEQLGPTHSQEEEEENWDTDLEDDDSMYRSMSVAELYLQACQQTGAAPVSSFLRNMGATTVNLNYYHLGPLRAKALAVVLENDNIITSLEMRDSGVKPKGTYYLMKGLSTNTTIQSLNLSHNQLGLKGAIIVSDMLLDNLYVKSINLAGNRFDEAAAKYLADALKDDNVVKELDLSYNSFQVKGGEYLGQLLARNVGIEVLNLSWNSLSKSSAVALLSSLKANSTLKKLQLSYNGLGRSEAESLGQALKQNSSLVFLDISNNRIDDQAVMLLCQGLSTNNTLRVLKLSHNPMTNTGALMLLKTVKNSINSAVEQIDISSVFVYETFIKLLEETLQNRPALDVQYSVMSLVTRNISALQTFKNFFEERNETIVDFFQALDKENTMMVSTSAFRTAVKEANIPLDQHQLEFLIKKFDENCTAKISYSRFAEL